MEQENNSYQPNTQAFLDSVAKDETAISPRSQQQFLEEEFPFTDEFDIDAFVAANDNSLEKTLTAMKAAVPEDKPQEIQDFNINLQKDKDENIKELETKISDIQNQIADTSKEQNFSSLPSELFEEQPAPATYVSSIKANDEFFTNIASTVDTLKGSLDNIVKARLQYEEGLVRQDQNLIARLREKTSRLKAINLALNSEVKRAKNEKLESLRKSAEQTKELLALRMQINQFQEQSKQGDFKFSRLEQQLALATQEKQVLEDEIAKIRQEKLDSFKASAEQTRQLMALRFDLAKTEDKFKQQEAQTLALQKQLEDFRQRAIAGDKDLYQGQISSLQNQLSQALLSSKNEAGLAGSLRENILILETSLAKTQGAKTALLAKAQEHLDTLFDLKNKYEQEISLIKNEQLKALETNYQQEEQKSSELANQVKQTLAVCRQQESFIKTLQLQIDSFKQAIAELEKTAPQAVSSSEGSLLKEAHLREISALQKTLQEEQNKYRNQNLEYQNLNSRLSQTLQQKQSLEEQISQLLSAKEEAKVNNNQYLQQIEELKKNYDDLQSKYNALNTKSSDNQMFELQKNALENELQTLLTQKIALITQAEEKNKAFAEFKTKSEEQIKQLREEAKQHISVLENKLANTQEKLKNEEENVSSLKSKISTLQETLNAKETENKNLISQEISSLKEQLFKAQSKFTQESVLLAQLQEESASKKEEFSTLEAKYNNLLGQKEELEKKITAQSKQIENLQKSLNTLKQELQAEKTARLQLEDKVSKLKAVNLALSAQVKQAREQKFAVLKKSAEQAKEILSLKEELAKAENFKTIEFENGLVQVRKEYEGKIVALEKQLKDLSERFAKQVQEIEDLKTDNAKLKKAEEEKFTLEEQYHTLSLHAKNLEEQISSYERKEKANSFDKAKNAALTMQLSRVKEEKKTISDQLEKARAEIKNLTDDGKEAHQALNVLKTQISQNDNLITKLRQDISALKQAKKQEDLQVQKNIENSAKQKPQPPKPPVNQNKENTASLSQTYTEPPTLPKKEQAAKQPNSMQEKKPEVQEQNNAQEQNDSKDTTTFSKKGEIRISDTQRERVLQEVFPDEQNMEAETFAEASNLNSNAEDSSKQFLDLSMIFGAKESIEIEDVDASAKKENTEKIKISANADDVKVKMQEIPMTDHSVKTALPRRAAAQEDQQYSDFLGKTKSVFYRIKWSLFKE